MSEMKAYFHVRDSAFVSDERDTIGVDKRSAIGRAHEEVIRQGITRFRQYGSFSLPDKRSIHLIANRINN